MTESIERIDLRSHGVATSPDYAVAPGRLVRAYMEGRGWLSLQLKDKLGIQYDHLQMLFGGHAAVTPELAKRLGEVFKMTTQFWLNAEANYRTTLARLEREKTGA